MNPVSVRLMGEPEDIAPVHDLIVQAAKAAGWPVSGASTSPNRRDSGVRVFFTICALGAKEGTGQ